MSAESDLGDIRAERVHAFVSAAEAIERAADDVVALLETVESRPTALHELDKTVRALRSYDRELPLLADRVPDGSVSVSLPFNNPLYSLVLYACGPAVAGGGVSVRPSSITGHVVRELLHIIGEPMRAAGIEVSDLAGRAFIESAAGEAGTSTLIFTGSWPNVASLTGTFPATKRLVYCGSGVSPFIVCRDAADVLSLDAIVELALMSRLFNSGQDCLCSERFFVHSSVMSEFLDRLVERVWSVSVGQMGDPDADVVPLLAGLPDRLQELAESPADWVVPFRRDEDLVHPSVAIVESRSHLMDAEKFGPMFTVAEFSDDVQLSDALDFDFRFGAVVCGSYDSEVLRTYPHVTRDCSVIDTEAEDCHVPFGGRRRSGFVSKNGQMHDGPILYAVECSVATTS